MSSQKEYVKPRFRKLQDNEYMDFYNSLKEARRINKHGLFVLLRDPEVYKGGQNFLIGNGIAGFSVKNNELISVHKNNKKAHESGVKHILPKMVRCAFKYGVKYADCYGEFLANYYMKSGFIAVASVPFEYIPDNPAEWDYKAFGTPLTYILIRGVKNVAELDRLKSKNLLLGLEDIQSHIKKFTNYEKAVEYSQNLLNNLQKYGYLNRIEKIKEIK